MNYSKNSVQARIKNLSAKNISFETVIESCKSMTTKIFDLKTKR